MAKNNPLMGADYRSTIFSPRWFIENMLYIVDKRAQLVQFKLNSEQSAMLEHVEFCLANRLPIRIIVLKARQIGSTTFFAALGFWLASMNKNITYGIVAHRFDSSESIFQKNKIFYNNLPAGLQPSTTQMSGEGITFDKKNGTGINSRIKFATVSDGVYRGQTMSYLHLSECAFWDGDIQAVENSLSPVVSENAGTIIVRESTANGYNKFKDDWDRAIKGKSGYTPFFFGWQDHEEYKIKVPTNFKLTDSEEVLKERLKLSNEQIAWRRNQITNNFEGNENQFQQEYPATAEEAFIASGTGVFNAKSIKEGYENCKEPLERITLKSFYTFEKLNIWEHPKREVKKIYAQKSQFNTELQDYEYVDTDLLLEEQLFITPYTVGIDTSGLGSDRNQIVVVNNITKKYCARYSKEVIGEEQLAMLAVEIAIMYNNALIAPEVNYSHEICNYVLKIGYKNLYITENLTRQDMTISGGIEYGWRTTTATKPSMISNLKALVDADPSLVEDRDFWEEAEYYLIENPAKNITNAASGHHDDLIIAFAIANKVSSSFQSKQEYTQVKSENNKGAPVYWLGKNNRRRKKTPLRKGIYNNNA